MATNAFKTDLNLLSPNDDGLAPGPRRLLTIHTFEGQDLDAAAMARYQQQPAAAGSYHIVIDREGVTARENDDSYRPWAAGTTGNILGYHFSLAGQAAYSRSAWLARPKQLDKLAVILAAYSRAYGIPLIRRSADEVRAGKWGLCGHAEISAAWHEVDHTDPGVNFPFDTVIARANEIARAATPPRKEPDMSEQLQSRYVAATGQRSEYRDTAEGYILQNDAKLTRLLDDELPKIHAKLDKLLGGK
mgnify:CR=1 FL=1